MASVPTAAAGDVASDRVCVPWGTVLPLAAVAALGSEFWVVAMRGAVGAVERTSGPFAVWLQESALMLPVYVLAVLSAVTLALRRFGPGPPRARAVVVTLLLVVLASTLAGVAVQAANAVYDTQLQAAQLAVKGSHGACDAACLADRQQSALLLQVRALGLGGLVMMVSNLVLLGLVVAFRGGRLDVAARRTGAPRGAPRRTVGRPGLGDVERFLVAGLLGAAAINVMAVRGHLAEWPAVGVFFVILILGQLAVAGLIVAGLRSAAFLAAAVVSAEPVLLWLSSWTTGVPFGARAGGPGPVHLADVAALLLEVGTLALAVVALRAGRRPRRRMAPHLRALVLVAAATVTAAGVAGGLVWTGAGAGAGIAPSGDQTHHARPVTGSVSE
jgi:hypothetical protein